jgi:hypothetical protein
VQAIPSQLTSLDLRDNELETHASTALVVALTQHPQIVRCEIQGNKFAYQSYRRLLNLVQRNRHTQATQSYVQDLQLLNELSEVS